MKFLLLIRSINIVWPIFGLLLTNIMEFHCREINFSMNPGCENDCTADKDCSPSNCEKPWLFYGTGENEDEPYDTIHYLWSFMELPTFIMMSSSNDSTISINWPALISGIPHSISFVPLPHGIFGTSFQSLIFFDDIEDTGTLDNIPDNLKQFVSLSEFQWTLRNVEKNNSDEWTINFNSSMFRGISFGDDFGIDMKLTSYGKFGREESLPHLIATPNTSQVEIKLKNLLLGDSEPFKSVFQPSFQNFTHLRLALDMIIISSDAVENYHYITHKSLDDEFTPGVFDLNSIASHAALPSSAESFDGGYIQWRPVCYLNSDNDINHSTYPNFNSSLPALDSSHIADTHKSLLYALFGENITNLLGAQTPVAFGQPKDGFYTKYNYTQWTFSIGLGHLPQESFSNLVIIVMSVGVGLPLLLIIIGGVYLISRRFRRTEDEPLLTE